MSDTPADIGEFLRSRRARLRPEDAGLPAFGGRRRVPGLRREELAQLAGVSADYYIRLEQGRLRNVSEAILDAVARALRLDDTERIHLHHLAKPTHRPPRRERRQPVRASTQWLLDALVATPAYVLGRRLDVVAWNDLASAVLGVELDGLAPDQRNMGRLVFLDDSARDLWADWDAKAQETVGGLRMHAGAYPDDPQLANLVGELSMKSPEFRRLWADQHVWATPHGTVDVRHPLVGDLTLAYETLATPDALDQLMVVYTAEPGSATHTALQLLASWTAGTADDPTADPVAAPVADPTGDSAADPFAGPLADP
ncbi:helix-turn-helix domain-containing protein [Rugosimonospora africana]|uniref:DNA-binding protein n=1 Tax=Rugosimonospora africana TaxID=556532 RepID=A0A8J3QXE5_9ACTN|nr:helix-turn-helix transcriptional regulator [Rugosimonospora africana]GIH18648.1 DNA-binding protein [Rugosimonospora africana]